MSDEYDPFFMSSGSAYTRLSEDDQAAVLSHFNNIITFFAMMHSCGIPLLPLKWQPARSSLGMGGTARVNQAVLHSQMSYAFKRVRTSGAPINADVGKWVNELFILSNPPIREHPNVIRLEGCCLDIDGRGRLHPVLVFERATLGDLEQFILSGKAESMEFKDMLDICIQLGYALELLHGSQAVHGDIKPSNVLLFSGSGDSRLLAKLSDFGYSSMSHDPRKTLVQLPYSEIWTAPDYHPRLFPMQEAQKMDIYSYGLICFWLLMGAIGQGAQPTKHIALWDDVKNLETLKARGNLVEYAENAFNLAHSKSVKACEDSILKLFRLTLADNREDRSLNWRTLIDLLKNEATADSLATRPTTLYTALYEQSGYTFWHFGIHIQALFKIRKFIAVLAKSGWRGRVGIVSQLHKAYEEGKCEKCRKIAAFEMAICSFLRFGNARSYGDHETWLEKSGHTKTDLEEAVLTARMVVLALDNSSPHESDKYLFAVNLSSDYQDLTLGEFQVLERSLIEEAEGCAQAFTEMNSVVVDLKRALAFLYQSRSMFREAAEIQEHIVRVISETIGDDPVGMKVRGDLSVTYVHLGRLHEAKELRTFVLNWLRKHYSPEDLHALSTMISLAGVTNNLGQHLEAEKLLLEALDVLKTKLGMENQMTLSAMTRLAAVYYDQNRLSEAEHLQLQVIELYKSSLGLDHELTWTTQLNLAAILSKLGRIKEAQQLELKILDLRKKRFGLKHDLTLTAIANLAAGYRLQKCWKEEESCLLQVVEGRKEVLGLFHPDTLLSSQALGNNYLHQGKYEAAESILRQVVQARTLLRGKSHPSTMASLNSLARVVFDKGDREKAEAMQLQTIKQGTKTLGESNVAVLECKRHLALMYQSWNRLGDAKILLTDVCNARKAALDKDHPDLNRVAQQIEDIDLKLAKTVKDE